jgi:hypothetical protein
MHVARYESISVSFSVVTNATLLRIHVVLNSTPTGVGLPNGFGE